MKFKIKTKMKKYLLILLAIAGLSACDKNKDYLITIHTEFGDMKVILYDETPLHKKNFIELAKAGKYDSTIWHRVIKDFMIQGGDVFAKEGTQEKEDDRIPAEIVPGKWHEKGALAAARQPDAVNPQKKSSSVQFYIVHGRVFSEEELTVDQVKLNQGISQLLIDSAYSDLKDQFVALQMARDFDGMGKLALANKELVKSALGLDVTKEIEPERLAIYTTTGGAPHLDKEYTVFGRVVSGLDVIDKIAAVQTGRMDRPVKNSHLFMEVEFISKKEITKQYGYEYPEEK